MNFRLKIFKKVAEKLSFTKAAKELFITQPAVTKHINNLEQEFKIKLFIRKGNKIELTEAGNILLKYAKNIENIYNQLDFELSALNQKQKGKIKIGASTTMTQYVLPQLMASFKLRFKDLSVSVINGNTEQIEKALSNNEIDLGIIEGQSKRSEFHYIEFLKDEIVLVAKSSNSIAKRSEISLSELQKLPLILREEGSGTLEVISYYLKQKNINFTDLSVEMQFGSTEGIKNYILNSDRLAFLSIQSILNELKRNELSIIDIADFEIKRNFNFIFPEGQQNNIIDLFIRFASHYNF
ncbi:MAG TPA: LysR family transcriptional regulator [Flavobacteriia bacterium]|nr:LysR family transcriptional regulator [Flavobacteriia bacterium]